MQAGGDKGKSRRISETLRDEILSGKFDDARKLPSDRMLMRRFAVARATVQSAMRELMDRRLVERRPGDGTYLVERARSKAARKFALIMPDGYYSFYERIRIGIEKRARELGWSVLAASLGSGDMRERARHAFEFAEVCVREKVGGVFFEPFQFLKDDQRVNRRMLELFDRAGIPVVLVDSDIASSPQRSEYDMVGIDNTAAGYAVAKHVIAKGAKWIWYFSSPNPAPTSLKRGTGVGIAVTEAGLHWKQESVFFADPTDARAARRLFAGRNRPDAIIASNDYIASILLKTLKAIGRRVPEDVLLTGVNGDPVSEETEPPLTTMVQPCAEIGMAAVEMMTSRIENPSIGAREMLFRAELVERRSTDSPAPSFDRRQDNQRKNHKATRKTT